MHWYLLLTIPGLIGWLGVGRAAWNGRHNYASVGWDMWCFGSAFASIGLLIAGLTLGLK